MSSPRNLNRMTMAAAVALLLAACGSAGVAPSETVPSASPVLTPGPTPADTPIDVVAAFSEQVETLASLTAEISGTVQVGTLAGEISGEMAIDGPDQHVLVVVTFPGVDPIHSETISVDGVSYQLDASGLWIEGMPGGGSSAGGPSLSALLQTSALELAGSEEADGRTLHRLRSTRPAAVGPEVIGLSDPTIADFEADVTFLAEDDGTPAGTVLLAEWVQGPAEAPVPAEFELRYAFDLDSVATIRAPADPWRRYASSELGYQLAHPLDWDVTYQPESTEYAAYDLYLGPIDDEVQVYAYRDIGAEVSANMWFRDSAVILSEDFGVEPELLTQLTVAGLPVQVFGLSWNDGTDDVFVQQAVVFGQGVAWDLDWYSEAGDEAEDTEQFLGFVNSFQPTEPARPSP